MEDLTVLFDKYVVPVIVVSVITLILVLGLVLFITAIYEDKKENKSEKTESYVDMRLRHLSDRVELLENNNSSEKCYLHYLEEKFDKDIIDIYSKLNSKNKKK